MLLKVQSSRWSTWHRFDPLCTYLIVGGWLLASCIPLYLAHFLSYSQLSDDYVYDNTDIGNQSLTKVFFHKCLYSSRFRNKMVLAAVLSMLRYVAGSDDRDFVDRLHSYFTCNILIGLSVLVSFKVSLFNWLHKANNQAIRGETDRMSRAGHLLFFMGAIRGKLLLVSRYILRSNWNCCSRAWYCI